MEEKIMNKITGCTQYKGYTAMQHQNYDVVFSKFLKEQQFSHILEIGTASGGFTLFLRETLPEAEVLSYDVNQVPWHDEIRKSNVDIRIQNIFDDKIKGVTEVASLTDEYAINFIKNSKKLLILCDGGNKIAEFNCLSKYMKSGDFIMAHDYSLDVDYFNNNIKNKIWLWCEIIEKDIENSCKIDNLEDYNRDEFQSVVWICKRKK